MYKPQLVAKIIGLFTLLTFSVTPAATVRSCSSTIAAEALWMKLVAMPLMPREEITTRILVLPRGRVAAATAILDAKGEKKEGRFFIADVSEKEPVLTLNLSRNGDKPDLLRELVATPNGTHIVGSGRNLAREAGLHVEDDGGYFAHQPLLQVIDPLADNVELIARKAEKAVSGDETAEESLLLQGLTPEFLDWYRDNPFDWRAQLAEMISREKRSLGIDLDPKSIPISNVDFHPNGNEFLVTSGRLATLRNAATGERRALLALSNDQENTPYAAYFLNRGKSIVSINASYLTLHDPKNGDIQHRVKLGYADVETVAAPIVFSPDRERMSLLMRGPQGNFREIWTVRPHPNTGNLKLVRRSRVLAQDDDMDSYPLVALADGDKRAVAQPNGLVRIVEGRRWWQFMLGGTDATEVRKLDLLEMTADGNFVAAAGRDWRHEPILELWNTRLRKGIRITLPSHDPGTFKRRLSDIRFSSGNDQLGIVLEFQNRVSHSKISIPYLIDIYRLTSRMLNKIDSDGNPIMDR